jgi:hypothetical protein
MLVHGMNSPHVIAEDTAPGNTCPPPNGWGTVAPMIGGLTG